MRILIVNPNTTAAMTEKIGRAGRAAAASGTELIVVNPADGPVSIEGYYDEAFSVPGLLAEIAKGDTLGVSAHIIACFDDTGLEAARSVALAPVIGIGEAAFHLASMLGHRFSVVTTLSRSIAAIENNLLKYGLAGRCGRVRASELPVLSLDDPSSDAAAQIGAEIELAKHEAPDVGVDLPRHPANQRRRPVVEVGQRRREGRLAGEGGDHAGMAAAVDLLIDDHAVRRAPRGAAVSVAPVDIGTGDSRGFIATALIARQRSQARGELGRALLSGLLGRSLLLGLSEQWHWLISRLPHEWNDPRRALGVCGVAGERARQEALLEPGAQQLDADEGDEHHHGPE